MDRIEGKDVLAVGSRVSWAAILAGAVLAITIYIALSVLGIAIGLSVSQRIAGEQLGTGAAIYVIAALLIALFIGGYVTSQTTVGESKGEALRYGLLLWGVMLLAAVWFAAQGLDFGFSGLLNQVVKAPTPSAGGTAAALPEDELRKIGLNDQQISSMQKASESLRARVGKLDVTAEAWWTVCGLVLSMAAAIAGAVAGAGPSLVLRGTVPAETFARR
jgi:hypothetical protein